MYESYEENIYKNEYIDELMDNDAIDPAEAGFIAGYNYNLTR
jgi:hypothetical protein